MSLKVIYLPLAVKIEKSLSAADKTLKAKLGSPNQTLTATELLPFVDAVRDLAELGGNLQATATEFGNRIAAYEATLSSAAAKPSSDFASQLDQRLTATSDLLRATLDRLDQVETAVMRLYKPPFLPIDPHDKPRKALAGLRASFDVACGGSDGSVS